MHETPATIRVTVRVRQQVEPALYEDLSVVGSYYRSKRLIQLAMLGLAAEQRGVRLDFPQRVVHEITQQQQNTQAPGNRVLVSPDLNEPQSAVYEPNLGALWETGLMK